MAPKPLKRKRATQPEEISFDFAARQEYLTGFHKRKLERAKHAREEAAKKEKEDRIRTRKLLRAQRKADLDRHVESIVGLGAKDSQEEDEEDDATDDSEWEGFADPGPVDRQDEFSDEDRHTTVVVEAVDITREGFRKVRASGEDEDEDEDEGEDTLEEDDARAAGSGVPPAAADSSKRQKRAWTKEAPRREKQKKKKFRYETKAERKATRLKERTGNAKAKAKRRA